MAYDWNSDAHKKAVASHQKVQKANTTVRNMVTRNQADSARGLTPRLKSRGYGFENGVVSSPTLGSFASDPASDRARALRVRESNAQKRLKRDIQGQTPSQIRALSAAHTQESTARTARMEEAGKMTRKRFDAGTMTAAESGRQSLLGKQQTFTQKLATKQYNQSIDKADKFTYEETDPITQKTTTKTGSYSGEGYSLLKKYDSLSEDKRSVWLKNLTAKQRQEMSIAGRNEENKMSVGQQARPRFNKADSIYQNEAGAWTNRPRRAGLTSGEMSAVPPTVGQTGFVRQPAAQSNRIPWRGTRQVLNKQYQPGAPPSEQFVLATPPSGHTRFEDDPLFQQLNQPRGSGRQRFR